jgi:hypothetical protein
MTLHPADGPLQDPFFAAVRRRHPDVDLVVLPPERAPAEPAEPVDDDVVRADLETVRTRLTEWAEAAGLTVDGDERLEPGDAPGTVSAAARLTARITDTAVVDRLALLAVELGWDVRRHRGPVEVLLGSADRLVLRGSYAASTGVLVLEVRAASVPVGRDRVHELLRGER